MNKIYAICTTLTDGTGYDKEQIKKSGIKPGDKIELENAKVGRWSTDVYLKGYKSSFNSVFFNFVDENGNEYDIYNDERFYTYSALFLF